jgi:hypothetical protein
LSPIGKPRQSILERKGACILFGGETPSALSFLLKVSSYREDQKTQSHNRPEKEGLIELERSLVHTRPVGMFKDLNLECEVKADKKDSYKDGEILETGPMPDHKVPQTLDVHRTFSIVLPYHENAEDSPSLAYERPS